MPTDKESSSSNAYNKIKNILIGILIAVILGYVFYSSFIRNRNEIGYLGADKSGRQIFIQTLDDYFEPDIKIDSDFNDYSVLSRMLIQEPMRTTIRFDIKNPQNKISLSIADDFLSQPYSVILDEYKGNVSIRSDSEISPDDLKKRLDEKGAKTVEDLFAGFGFKKFQIYNKGQHSLTTELKGTKNVYWTGGE